MTSIFQCPTECIGVALDAKMDLKIGWSVEFMTESQRVIVAKVKEFEAKHEYINQVLAPGELRMLIDIIERQEKALNFLDGVVIIGSPMLMNKSIVASLEVVAALKKIVGNESNS
jgi:hypothetical protein